MSLFVKIGNAHIKMSDIWCDEDAFIEVGSDGIKELVQDDLLSFVAEINLLDHVEFYWRSE